MNLGAPGVQEGGRSGGAERNTVSSRSSEAAKGEEQQSREMRGVGGGGRGGAKDLCHAGVQQQSGGCRRLRTKQRRRKTWGRGQGGKGG